MMTACLSDRELQRIARNLPTKCPACGSERVQPLFWLDADTWDCADCCAIFSERD